MQLFRKLVFSLFTLVVLTILGFMPAAAAQTPSQASAQASSEGGWHVGVSPYFWLAGIHGTVGALGKEASVHASFGDIFSQLNIGLMGSLETRHNRIVMPVDFIWMNLSDEQTLPAGLPITSVKAEMTQVVLTPKAGYRVVDNGNVKVDALVGFRYWHMRTTLTPQPTGPAPSESANWVDVLAGGRMQAKLKPKLGIAVLGDIGGGGANSDYQAAGLLGYELNKKWSLSGGYRYMSVNYRPDSNLGFVDDTATSGIILGVTWNIK
jgi:hypothetical protein